MREIRNTISHGNPGNPQLMPWCRILADQTIHIHTRYEVLTAVKTSMLSFWVATPCGLGGRYHLQP
jgi:hypothetical protein